MAAYTWTTGVSASWDTPADWTTTPATNTKPNPTGTALTTTTDTASIDGTAAETVTVTASEFIDAFSVTDPGATLLLSGAAAILTAQNTTTTSNTNDGTITVNGAAVHNDGNYTGTGSVTIENNGRFGIGGADSNTGAITFGAGTSNVLDFDTAQAATTSIDGMTDGDVIALSQATYNASNQPTYGNGVLTYVDAPGKTYTFKLVNPTTTQFHVVVDSVNGGAGVDIVTGAAPVIPPVTPPTTTPPGTTPPATTAVNFAYTDTTTHAAGTSAGTAYSGPVSGITQQYIWSGSDNVALSANTGSVFMHGGPGDDALTAISGTNVLDGGAGSNFLVGAPGGDGGFDTFFDDGRGGGVTWDTLVHFHQGDAVTIFGFTGGLSTMQWADNQGATGYQGATMHSELAGAGTGINATVTFAGLSVADAQAKLTISTGNVDGNAYLYLKYA